MARVPFRLVSQYSVLFHNQNIRSAVENDFRLISCLLCRVQRHSTVQKLQPNIDSTSSSNDGQNFGQPASSKLDVSRITGNDSADKALHALSGGRISVWMQKYEDLVGLTEVREAQSKVMLEEGRFRDVQTERRRLQHEMTDIHGKLKDLHAAIDKVQRGDERYLALLTQEYEIIREEKRLAERVAVTEQLEREQFSALSSAVRESHEKERARAERTKYWSVIGSVIGAAIGIIGTTINNRMRMKELKGLVKESAEGGAELKGVVAKLTDTTTNQYNQLQLFLSDLKQIVGSSSATSAALGAIKPLPSSSVGASASSKKLEEQTEEILARVKEQDKVIGREINEIRKLLALQLQQRQQKLGSEEEQGTSTTVVYVGPEVETLLSKTEENLEWKLKINALMVASLLYGAGAVTLYFLTRGATS